ncbi:MAG TPA: hypothetical protein VJ719_03680 [Chthoniobacterales bacterium]|nr:hypothetical protein [Chthoniobacterales bacterium]
MTSNWNDHNDRKSSLAPGAGQANRALLIGKQCDILLIVMRRWFSAGLLVICLGVFLCPAIGKPDAAGLVVAPSGEQQSQSCEMDNQSCAAMSEPVDHCCSLPIRTSQTSQSCATACSSLILIYAVVEKPRAPLFAELSVLPDDRIGEFRADRPPVPPPRV